MDRSAKVSTRIMSIDALRGFDMLMIIFADRFFFSLNKGVGSPASQFLEDQFQHPDWFGSHFYDIIMPLFLFIVGVVIPYSLSKKIKENVSKTRIYKSLIRRFIILFVLGWIVQGNLLAFDLDKFQIMSNTLQAIAIGYLFSSMAYIHLTKKWRYVFFAACLIVYAVLLTVPNIPGIGRSELMPDKNYALYIEKLVFGKFADSSGEQYTWLLSGIGFTATVLSGVFAGELIRSNYTGKKITTYLCVIGSAGVILGLFFGIWYPIVKKIWTSTFVLFSSGICFLFLALFYWIIDVKGYYKWTFPLRVIGMNAIIAYVASHVLNFPGIAHSLLFGLEQYVGAYYEVITTIGGFGILYLLLWYMYRNNTLIKI
jgi:predicted acyltransferase